MQTVADKPFGKMTIAELRAYATQVGLDHDSDGKKINSRTARGKLLGAILNWERNAGNRAEDAQAVESEPAPQPAEEVPALGGSRTVEPKGRAKAEKFAAEIKPAGWDISIDSIDDTQVELVAKRKAEILNIVWDKGVFLYEPSGHTIADRHTRVRNVSQARQFAARSVEAAALELGRVAANKAWKKKAPEKPVGAKPAVLPFAPETATDAELLSALRGRYVRWTNRLTNSQESAYVSKDPRYFAVTEHEGERVVQFCGSNGFRAFRLKDLLKVGKAAV